ncbi:hypothetical protein BJX99DRAFT_257924 [Aspergillus californicus]
MTLAEPEQSLPSVKKDYWGSSRVQSYKKRLKESMPAQSGKLASWGRHNDESHEKYPTAYSVFKVAKSPPTGVDILFVSAYGPYDRLSEPFQKFAETLTATHHAGEYHRLRENGVPFEANVLRGHPENIGFDSKQSQCVKQPLFPS